MPSRNNAQRLAARLLSSTLCAVLVLSAVGPQSAAHAAAIIKAVPAQAAGLGGLGAAGASYSGASLGLSNTLTLAAPTHSAALSQAPAILVAPSLISAANSASVNAAAAPLNSAAAASSNISAPLSAANASAAAAAQPGAPKQGRGAAANVEARGQEAAGREAKPTAFSALQSGALKINQAAAPSAHGNLLRELFSGARNRQELSDRGAVFADGEAPKGPDTPSFNSESGAAQGRQAAPGSKLEPSLPNAGEKTKTGAAAASEPRKPKASVSEFSDEVQQRAVNGLTINRALSLLSGSIGGIAYPLMVIAAVGQVGFYNLSGLGSLVNIPLALLAGVVGTKLSKMGMLKGYTIFNVGLRAAISAVQALFFINGWLTFWPLLFLTILSAWQFSTLFSNDYSLNAEILGGDKDKIRSSEAQIRMTTIALTVITGLVLGAATINALGFFWTFLLVAAIQALSIPVLQRMLPAIGARGEGQPTLSGLFSGGPRALASLPLMQTLRSIPTKLRAWAGKKGAAATVIGALAITAATLIFFIPIPGAPFLLKSPIPFVIVSAVLIWRSESSKLIRSDALLRASLLFVMIGAFIEVPLRNSVLGVLAAETFSSAAQSAAYLGSLVAAFYLGQAPSGTGMLDAKLTFKIGKLTIPFRNVMKWVGAASVAAWAYFVLLPPGALFALLPAGLSGILAPLVIAAFVAAVFAGYFALHNLTPKITDTAWMKLEAGALLFMAFPLFFGLAPWSVYVALAVFGFVLNGSQRMVSATYTAQTKKLGSDKVQMLSGMRGAFFNIATALAYTTYSVSTTLPKMWGETHAFPFTWYVIAATYAVFAFLFWRGSAAFATPSTGDAKAAKKTP